MSKLKRVTYHLSTGKEISWLQELDDNTEFNEIKKLGFNGTSYCIDQEE